jgi:hypothetical protein
MSDDDWGDLCGLIQSLGSVEKAAPHMRLGHREISLEIHRRGTTVERIKKEELLPLERAIARASGAGTADKRSTSSASA